MQISRGSKAFQCSPSLRLAAPPRIEEREMRAGRLPARISLSPVSGGGVSFMQQNWKALKEGITSSAPEPWQEDSLSSCTSGSWPGVPNGCLGGRKQPGCHLEPWQENGQSSCTSGSWPGIPNGCFGGTITVGREPAVDWSGFRHHHKGSN
jgi:hypothetical protein